MKKTQLGPGSTHGESTEGKLRREGNRPACRSSQDGPVRATQPYEVIAGQRAWKLQPNRVTVVPQA